MKKLFLLLPVAVLALTGCQQKGEKISLKEAMSMMESQKVEEYPNDISANFKISTLETRTVASYEGETQEQFFALRDLKLGAAFSGFTATDANLLKASVDFSLGSIQMKSGGVDSTIKDLAASAYLQEQKLYLDVSNETVYNFLIAQNALPADAPKKLVMPVDFSDVTLPLLSDESIKQIIGGIEQGGGSGSGSAEIDQITSILSSLDEESLDSLFEIYVNDNNKDFDITFSMDKKDILRIMEKMYAGGVENPTSEMQAAIQDAMTAMDKALTDGKFSHIKVHASIDDCILKKFSIDIDAGIKISEEGMNSDSHIKFKSEFSLNLSSKIKNVSNADEYKALA